MTRTQRRVHLVVWMVLPALLGAALIVALVGVPGLGGTGATA